MELSAWTQKVLTFMLYRRTSCLLWNEMKELLIFKIRILVFSHHLIRYFVKPVEIYVSLFTHSYPIFSFPIAGIVMFLIFPPNLFLCETFQNSRFPLCSSPLEGVFMFPVFHLIFFFVKPVENLRFVAHTFLSLLFFANSRRLQLLSQRPFGLVDCWVSTFSPITSAPTHPSPSALGGSRWIKHNTNGCSITTRPGKQYTRSEFGEYALPSVFFFSYINPIPTGGGGGGEVHAPISTFENFLDI